jgi:hypothetical protein
MLEKSLTSPADCIAYDLEDAVAENQKGNARRLVTDFLNVSLVLGPKISAKQTRKVVHEKGDQTVSDG